VDVHNWFAGLSGLGTLITTGDIDAAAYVTNQISTKSEQFTYQDVGNTVLAGGDILLNGVLNTAGDAIGGGAGLVTLIGTGGDLNAANYVIKNVSDDLKVDLFTQQGKDAIEAIAPYVDEYYEKPMASFGEYTLDKTGSPLLATLAHKSVEIGGTLLGGRSALKSVKGLEIELAIPKPGELYSNPLPIKIVRKEALPEIDKALLDKLPISSSKVDEIRRIPHGERPNAIEYLPDEYYNNHIGQFDRGASYLVPKEALDTWGRDMIGRPDGQFVSPAPELDDLIYRTQGDLAKIEKELGIPEGMWQGKEFARIDVANPRALNIRVPSGNEGGANGLWIPGGRLPTGQLEATLDQIPKSRYTETSLMDVVTKVNSANSGSRMGAVLQNQFINSSRYSGNQLDSSFVGPLPQKPLLLTHQNPTTLSLNQVKNLRGNERWQAGEQYIQELYGSGGQRHFTVEIQEGGQPITGTGGRFVDAPVDVPNGVMANEVKTYQQWRTVNGTPQQNSVPLSEHIQQQVNKDLWLRDNRVGFDPRWHFIDAPPSVELSDYLTRYNIIHITY